MEYDTRFAKRSFPAHAPEIEALAFRSESFCELCHDYSVAGELVEKWESSTAPERNERYAEAVELIEDLGKEIESTLNLAKIVPFPLAR